MMENPYEDIENIPDRQPAYCPYCGQDNGFDGQGATQEGYKHHCADCGLTFITIVP